MTWVLGFGQELEDGGLLVRIVGRYESFEDAELDMDTLIDQGWDAESFDVWQESPSA